MEFNIYNEENNNLKNINANINYNNNKFDCLLDGILANKINNAQNKMDELN